MKILFVSSEVAPFSKVGGLAEVSHGLPKALKRLGHEVIIVSPKYRSVEYSNLAIKKTNKTLGVPISWKMYAGQVFKSEIDGIPVYLIARDELFDRDGIYGTEYGDYQDNAERFTFFSRAVLELCITLNLDVDVIHCNDWHTALIPVYLKTLYKDMPILSKVASLYTIHNLGYQGIFWQYDMPLTGLPWELFAPSALEFYGKINFMKGGIVFADIINTVSRKYLTEIQTEANGCGLDGVLRERSQDLFFVFNGVDYDIWNPATDQWIAANYAQDSIENKALCKADLRRVFDLNDSDSPLIVMVSKLIDRKGLDLVTRAFDNIISLDLQLVILGKGEDRYQTFLVDMATKYKGKLGIYIGYDAALNHKILAGSDIFLMPSKYEPCGLDQLYSLKYGTIPIVRAVGGLDDTVVDYDTSSGIGTGFKFTDYTPEALMGAIERAINLFKDKHAWLKLMKQAMTQDFSWESSAHRYVELYKKAIAKRKN
ncbi:MAG TPA: glycogen synthase GlgA [Syntrophaceae bacterium]|nr:glycogen synthase GlgA [Syntrophaceae bacterium]